jgi:hypothetical protein
MKVVVPLMLAVLALAAACAGPSPAPSAGTGSAIQSPSAAPAEPAATPTPAAPNVNAVDLDAMAHRIFPGAHPAGCGELAACPVTDRLRARVEQLSHTPPDQPGPVAQFCRCQNGAQSMTVTSEPSGSGGVSHVVLIFGAGTNIKIDLLFVRSGDSRLLLDDTQCTGHGPSTSLYAPTMAACGA